MENKKKIFINYTAIDSDKGLRVDQIVAREFPEYSRAHIQKWIKDGVLLVNGKKVKAKQTLSLTDNVIVDFWEDAQLVDLPAVSYTHLRAHETGRNLVCRLLLEKKKK